MKRKKPIPKSIKKTLISKCNNQDRTILRLFRKEDTWRYKMECLLLNWKNRFRIEYLDRFDVPFISVFLTQRCTLKCRKCSDLIPYYQCPQNFPVEEVESNIRKYLSAVDSVHYLLLAGGETFLYPELARIITFCLAQEKIKNIGIVSNGTVLPTDEMCRLLKNPKISVRVSAYPCVEKQRGRMLQKLRQNYVMIEDLQGQKWYDVGDFQKRNRNKRQLQQVFQHCEMNQCFEIDRDKVLYCARQRGCEVGVTPAPLKGEYVLLKTGNHMRLRKELLRMYAQTSLSTCDYCDGITEQSREIIPGEQ